MSKACFHRALLVAGLAATAATLAAGVANAQDARDQAIERCLAVARASSPGITPGGATGENRAAVYKDCMTRAGYRP